MIASKLDGLADGPKDRSPLSDALADTLRRTEIVAGRYAEGGIAPVHFIDSILGTIVRYCLDCEAVRSDFPGHSFTRLASHLYVLADGGVSSMTLPVAFVLAAGYIGKVARVGGRMIPDVAAAEEATGWITRGYRYQLALEPDKRDWLINRSHDVSFLFFDAAARGYGKHE